MPVPMVAPSPMAVRAHDRAPASGCSLPSGAGSMGRTAHICRSSDGRDGARALVHSGGVVGHTRFAWLLLGRASTTQSLTRGRAAVRAGERRRACASICAPATPVARLRFRRRPLMSTAAPPGSTPPPQGAKITIQNGKLSVPDNPIIPFIEGDGTGPDIWRASVRVFDAAVQKAYGGKRKIHWIEVLRRREGQQALQHLAARRDGRRRAASTCVASRARSPRRSAAASARSTSRCGRCSISTSACAPCAGSRACPRPVKQPGQGRHGDLPREHRGHLRRHRVRGRHGRRKKFLELFHQKTSPRHYAKIRFPDSTGIGIKPVSKEGTERLVRAADRVRRSPTSARA